MMDLTDRHARYLMRLISTRALLYTEMVTTQALLRGDLNRLLSYHASEHPLALQLGGSDVAQLAECTALAAEHHFDEVNLNVGCPSDRVQSGRFGACLMLEPALVAECFQSMAEAADIDVTIKCRIGVDDQEPRQALFDFVEQVADAGCTSFTIHARKAWLKGLSPKQNRDVPPLDYDIVYRLKEAYPHLELVINGGITTIEESKQHLKNVDGVMLGRAAYYQPFLLADVDTHLFDTDAVRPEKETVFKQYLHYVDEQLAQGVALKHMSKHVLGLFHGDAGARRFRRHISENAYSDGAGRNILEDAYALMSA